MLTILPRIANLQMLVGALGEQLAWWPTQVASPGARRTLELLFPRTSVQAARATLAEAGRIEHDGAAYSMGPATWHLFRLPANLEDRLQTWLAEPGATIAWPPADPSALKDALRAEANGVPRPPDNPRTYDRGPTAMGSPSRLGEHGGLAEVAAAYLHAAESNQRIVPYFVKPA